LEYSLTAQPIQAIREVVCAANHMTDIDEQEIHKLNTTQKRNKWHRIQQNNSTVVQSPLTTGNEMGQFCNAPKSTLGYQLAGYFFFYLPTNLSYEMELVQFFSDGRVKSHR